MSSYDQVQGLIEVERKGIASIDAMIRKKLEEISNLNKQMASQNTTIQYFKRRIWNVRDEREKLEIKKENAQNAIERLERCKRQKGSDIVRLAGEIILIKMFQ